MSYGFYLYGIFPTPGPRNLELQGLDKQVVESQQIDGFVFLYSQALQQRYLASRRNLLDHEKVLEAAMHAGHRTLLPLQFGLIVEDWETVTQNLTEPYGDRLQQLFAKLEGKREVGVKVLWDTNEELQRLLNENPQLQEKRDRLEGKPLSMDEVIAIGQTLEQSMQNRQLSIVNAFQSSLNPLSLEIVENDLLTDSMIYNSAYLIPWESETLFAEKIEELDQKFTDRLRIRYNNFTAPYNFAKLD